MDDLIGRELGPYRVVSKLGEGGMAAVYKGFQESLGRYVAIKVLHADLARDQEFVTRFRREALAAAGLGHPNIVPVYDAGVAGGAHYIVMALVEGGSLKDRIARGPLPVDEAVSIAAQLADALQYAHEQGIIHRDVKPGNVLMAGSRPVLTDFGIAKALSEATALTRTGTSIGTPEYMAPEQINGAPVDGRADLYALGLILYEMLAGRTPFKADTPMSTLYRQVNEPAPPLCAARPDAPAWLEAVAGRALAKQPEARYATAGELARALRAGGPPAPAAGAGDGKRSTQDIPALPGTARPKDRRDGKDMSAPTGKARAKDRSDKGTGPAASSPRARPEAAPYRVGRRLWVWLLAGAVTLLVVLVGAGGVWLASGGRATPSPTAPVAAVSQPTATASRRPATAAATVPPTSVPTPVPPRPGEGLRVGMVSDVGGVDDASFNQNTWDGLRRAQDELGVQAKFIESQAQADYEKNITEFAEQKYDLIITVGFLLADATNKMAAQYPDQKLAIIDSSSTKATPNLKGIIFNVDEAAFPAGYLAAAWADMKDPADPKVGWVAGMQIPPVEQFIVAYENGVKYYNAKKGKNVQVRGVYVGDFEAPDQGKTQGLSLIDEGIDVIFGCGGKTGNGGLTAAKERGKWGIGVDVDQYNTLPNEKDILISSVMKRLDNAVFAVVQDLANGAFRGGANYVATARNGGVGLAPFHEFDGQVPAWLRKELDDIRQGIIDGTIKTGWPMK